ncbi:hypothetical protein EAF00_008490 [Botryotinia globosa]|nr:hypothetical protein EAF00_008490 [Botryotinia globosa]
MYIICLYQKPQYYQIYQIQLQYDDDDDVIITSNLILQTPKDRLADSAATRSNIKIPEDWIHTSASSLVDHKSRNVTLFL